MISIQKKFLFIHVPKTGGNSVQNILRDYSEDKIAIVADHQDVKERFEVRNDKYDIKKHSVLIEYKRELEPSIYQKEILTKSQRKLISKIYAQDIKLFQYSF